jgi:hypothetical protein
VSKLCSAHPYLLRTKARGRRVKEEKVGAHQSWGNLFLLDSHTSVQWTDNPPHGAPLPADRVCGVSASQGAAKVAKPAAKGGGLCSRSSAERSEHDDMHRWPSS